MSLIRHVLNGPTAALVASLGAVTPAYATGEISCTATDGSEAAIFMVIGRLPVLHVVRAEAVEGTTYWVTDPRGDGEKAMVFGQGLMDERQVLADFTDPNVERIVVSLRLFQASGDNSFAQAGVLSFEGASVHPVQCING